MECLIGEKDQRIPTMDRLIEPNTVIATGDGAYYKIKALQEPYDFARWVASEIFDDMWEYNKDSFAEIACRKLAKLGIVRAKSDEWELVEQEPLEVEATKLQQAYNKGFEDCRQAAIKSIDEKAKRIQNADTLNGLAGAVAILFESPSVKPQDCDTCEVGNPCLYCKHEFEEQESEEI